MFNQNRKPLYRNKSLARLSSPEGLDEMMKVINPKSWLVLIAYISLFITGIIWSIFGYIPITIKAEGQLVNLGEIQHIQSSETGHLTLKVRNGDKVEKGEVIAVIDKFDSKENSETKIISNISGRVLWTESQGKKILSNNNVATIEKYNSSFQRSIICLSLLEDCQKIKDGKKVQITVSEMQEENFEPSMGNRLTPEMLDRIIQVQGNVEIDNKTKEKLGEYSQSRVSMRIVNKPSPISFIFPTKKESNNGTK